MPASIIAAMRSWFRRKPKMVDIEIDIPDDLYALCCQRAKEQGITFNEYVSNAIEDFLESHDA